MRRKQKARRRIDPETAHRTLQALIFRGNVTRAAEDLGVSTHTVMAHAEFVMAEAPHWTARYRGLLGVLPRAMLMASGLTEGQVAFLLSYGVRNLVPGLGEKRAPILLKRLGANGHPA